MKSVYDYLRRLDEAPRKMKGDAPFPELSDLELRVISTKVLKKYKEHVDIELPMKLSLYEDKSGNGYFVVGYFSEEERFSVVTELAVGFIDNESSTKQIKGKKLCQIESIHTCKEWRGAGISTALYTYILNKGYVIISDDTQYEGAINLWKGFLRVPNSKIYIYNIEEDIIVATFTKNTPMSHVWSDDDTKRKIRLVFVKD